MKSEKVLLSQVKLNADNPRKITDGKLELLVKRLLAFPKMIEIRPVVVDAGMVAIGGNMRLRALNRIAGMTLAELKAILFKTRNYRRQAKADKKKLVEYWKGWLQNPTVEIVNASELTEEEKKEFVIADNASFGEFDWDALSSDWDAEELTDWGVDLPGDWSADDKAEKKKDEGGKKDGNDHGSDDEGKDQEEDNDQPAVLDVLFPSDNDFEVPALLKELQGGRVELPITPWGANARLNKDVATYHFYVDDYRFDALFKDPLKLVASGCKSIVEPNCSLHDQTPIAFGLQLIYKKRWLARYMQEIGARVYVDLNVSAKFAEYNLLGVPEGWDAFFTRGLTDMAGLLENDLAIARRVSGRDTPNLVVYGGGRKAEEFCQRNGLLYITDFINEKKKHIKKQ